MEKTCFRHIKKKKKIFDSPTAIFEYIIGQRKNLLDLDIDEEETENYDYIMYEYIELVYPPDSKPPMRKSFDKFNLIDFNLMGFSKSTPFNS